MKIQKMKAIRNVINIGKNKNNYISPKVKISNKFINSDFCYDDENNDSYKGDKLLI